MTVKQFCSKNQVTRAPIEGALQTAALAQGEYWDALRELEIALGEAELDGTSDLQDETVESLIKWITQ